MPKQFLELTAAEISARFAVLRELMALEDGEKLNMNDDTAAYTHGVIAMAWDAAKRFYEQERNEEKL